jgi:hypothetical protein
MSTTHIARPAATSEAAIFTRLWESGDGEMTPEIARHVLRLGFSDQDRARMHELAVKNQESTLSPAERDELDSYVKVGDLLALLQSKARILLNRPDAKKRRHG